MFEKLKKEAALMESKHKSTSAKTNNKNKSKNKKSEINMSELFDTDNQTELTQQDDETENSENKGSKFEGEVSLDDAIGFEKRPSRTRLLFNMYFTMFQHYLSKGKHLRRMNLDDESLQIEYDRIFTKSSVKGVWTIKSTDEFLPENFFGLLKSHLDAVVPGSRTSIILTPAQSLYEVDFSKKDVIDKVDYWSNMKEVADRRESNQTEADRIKDLKDSKKRKGIRRMFNSFTKYKRYMAKQFKFAKFYIAIEGIVPENEDLEHYAEALSAFCSQDGIKVELKRITNLQSYLNAMSLSTKKPSKFKKTLDTIILSDLDIAELDSYSQGSVGDKIGVYVGTDIETNYGVYLNFTATTKAQNILITALTGAGKSFFIKVLLIFHALCKHRLAIMDYEGREYIRLVKWLKGITISMGLTDSVCVNTLHIPDVSGMSLVEAKAAYMDSYNATERIFKILINVDNEQDCKDDDIQMLFQELMQQLHLNTPDGPIVKDDISTYYRSKHLNYFKLYKVLEKFAKQDSFNQKYGKLVNLSMKRLEPYWGELGQKRYLFEDEIDIQQLYNSRILHFNYGMQNVTDDSAPPKEIILKMSMMTYVFSKYHAYNLKNGFYTVNLVEEFQRSGNSKELLRTVNHWITGGRKGNIVNYIVTNSVAILLNRDDTDAQAIKENLTHYIIGKLRKTSRDQLVNAFDLEEHADTMRMISTNPQYENCFLIIFDTGHVRDKVITMMQIDPRYLQDEYFKTRRQETYEEWEL